MVMGRGTEIAFFLNQPGFHTSHNFWAKPKMFNNLLGLVYLNGKVEVLPQGNTYYPQMYIYDFNKFDPKIDGENIKAIHEIWKYIASHARAPSAVFNGDSNKIELIDGPKCCSVLDSLPLGSFGSLKGKPIPIIRPGELGMNQNFQRIIDMVG